MRVEIRETIDSPWGPLQCVASAEQRVVATIVDPDPYPRDVLAACPRAKEWGIALDQNHDGSWSWVAKDGSVWGPRWEELVCGHVDGWCLARHAYFPREHAIKNAPTVPPPGYVAAKANPLHVKSGFAMAWDEVVAEDKAKEAAKSNTLLDELAEVAYERFWGTTTHSPLDRVHKENQNKWRAIALAVARRLLEREATPEEIDTACDAYLLVKGQGDGVRVNLGRMVDALKASRRAQLAELEGKA